VDNLRIAIVVVIVALVSVVEAIPFPCY